LDEVNKINDIFFFNLDTKITEYMKIHKSTLVKQKKFQKSSKIIENWNRNKHKKQSRSKHCSEHQNTQEITIPTTLPFKDQLPINNYVVFSNM